MSVLRPECPENHAFKIVIGSLSSVLLVVLSLFIHVAWSTAEAGVKKAEILEPKVAVLEASILSINRDTSEIKKDVKELLRK